MKFFLEEDRLLLTAEVAEYLQVDVQNIRKWIRQGKLEAIILPNGNYRIHTNAVKTLLDNKTNDKG